jgi:hypothetical protein
MVGNGGFKNKTLIYIIALMGHKGSLYDGSLCVCLARTKYVADAGARLYLIT